MKTTEEKAKELCMYFKNLLFINLTNENFIHSDSKKCAIKCVEEIITNQPIKNSLVYWNDVINEIKKL